MKKIYTLLVLMLALWGVQAQVSSNNLQGRWKLFTYDDGSALIDIEKRTFALHDDYKAGLSAAELKEEEHNYSILLEQYTVAILDFKGSAVDYMLGEEVYKGTFSVNTTGNVTELTITDTEGTFTSEIILKDTLLYIDTDEDGSVLVYKKM